MAVELESPVQYLKGVGPHRARLLGRLGVRTVRDLIFLLPRRFDDFSQRVPVSALVAGQDATVVGTISSVGRASFHRRRDVVSIGVRDETGRVSALWFNRPDLRWRFRTGQRIMLSGRVSSWRGLQFTNAQFTVLDEDEEGQPALRSGMAGQVVPVYPLTEGLAPWEVRRAVRQALDDCRSQLVETLPDDLRVRRDLAPLDWTLANVHFPGRADDGARARRRLVFEELFYFELMIGLRRLANLQRQKGTPLATTGRLTAAFRQALPFTLTRGQEQVLAEIVADLASPHPMNRLLQGDVGSGKTVLAIYAMLIAAENGRQAVLMAPTEVLAQQHHAVWAGPLHALGVRAELLVGSLPARERRRVHRELAAGEVHLAFGTHALLEGDVDFAALGLCVVDEQHRFGVMQRASLIAKGTSPDFLVMSATPIPRTLALTVYGDLDISSLREKPPGRRPVITRLGRESQRAELYDFLAHRVDAGAQVFIVCPIIAESEKLDLRSAEETFAQVRARFGVERTGLLHGRLPARERAAVMERFRAGQLALLVATTVIEVGVDIPQASVMVIEHPERFGLAQLHQLRGRVGRGSETSYCLLVYRGEPGAPAYERLRFFVAHDDGFELAEKDLELRGPGEVLGARQHGLPELSYASFAGDMSLLLAARDDARDLLGSDPQLAAAGHAVLRRNLKRRFGQSGELLGIG